MKIGDIIYCSECGVAESNNNLIRTLFWIGKNGKPRMKKIPPICENCYNKFWAPMKSPNGKPYGKIATEDEDKIRV